MKKIVLRLSPNEKGRDFVCGDIHGCFNDLEYALRRIKFDKSRDRLFSTGDIIDRGPDSHLAADYLCEKWFFPVLGNHEDMLAGFFRSLGGDFKNFDYQNGSAWSREMPDSFLEKLCSLIDKLPLIITAGDSLIVHAALPPVSSLDKIEENPERFLDTILWNRGAYPPLVTKGVARVYCGHTITDRVENYGGIINIDTGCFLKHYGSPGRLTVRELNSSQDARLFF